MKNTIHFIISVFTAFCVMCGVVPVFAEETPPTYQTVTLIVETYYNDALYSGKDFPVEVRNADTGEVIGNSDELIDGRAYIELTVSADENTPITIYQVKGDNPLVAYDETVVAKVVTKDGKIVDPNQVPKDPSVPGPAETEKQAQIAEVQRAVADAEHAYNKAKAEYDAAVQAVQTAQANAPDQAINAFGFFSAQDDQTAYEIITGKYSGKLLKNSSAVSYSELVKYTGDFEGSAVSLSNMRSALELIDEVNAKRVLENQQTHAYRNGLQPFKVTDSMMAVAILTANYNEYHEFAHPQTFNVAENIATMGKGYAVDAWYGERDIFWADPDKGEQMKNLTAWQLYQYYPDIYFNVGHYLNVVSDAYPYIGLAVAGDNGMTSMDIYWYTCGSEGAYTTDEYRARLDAYEVSSGESDEVRQAKALLTQAEEKLNLATESFNNATDVLNALLNA